MLMLLKENFTEVETGALGGGWVGGASLTCSILPENNEGVSEPYLSPPTGTLSRNHVRALVPGLNLEKAPHSSAKRENTQKTVRLFSTC